MLSTITRRFLITFSCSVLLFSSIIAQEVRDNFSTGSIYDLKKDGQGRIWLATNSGVYVSDGMNYIQIVIGDAKTTNSSIREIVVDDENIFIILQDKGLIELNSNTLSYTKISDKPVSGLIIEKGHKAIILFRDGVLYTLAFKNKNETSLQKVFDLGYDHDNEPKLANLSNEFILISEPKKGLYKLNKQNWKIEKSYSLIPNGFNNMFSHLGNQLFFINEYVVYELNDKDEFTESKYVKLNRNISYLLPINKEEKIVIRSRKNIYLEKNGKEIQFNLQKTKNYEVSNALFLSKDNVIFGSNQGILKVYNIEQKVRPLYDSAVQMQDFVNIRRKIIPYSENEVILFGYPKSHIYNFKTNQYRTISEKISPLFDAVLINNVVYATSEGGGVKKIDISSKKFSNISTKDIDTVRYYGAIADIGYLMKDHIVVGRRGEFVLYNYKTNTSKMVSLNNVNAKINAIVVDSVAKLIYLATNEGLYFYNPLIKSVVKKTKINGLLISDLAILRKDGKSSLWYISDQGLSGISLDNNKLLAHIGLINFNYAKLTSLIIDAQKKMWISSYNGVYAYDYPIDNVIALNNRNGLVNREYNFKSGCLLPNGQVIFGGLNGYDLIEANLFKYSGKPIKGTVLGYSTYGFNSRVYDHFNKNKIVQYNTKNYYLEVYFSIKDFEKFKYSDFEFKIDNGGWVPLLGYSYLYMYNLKDGIHTIDIRGYDDSGNPVVFDTIKVNQQTDFIESTNFRYFLFFIVIILMIVTGFIYYYNNKQLNTIKVNIAMDLHDEIGSILNRSLYTMKDDPVLSKQTQLINYLSEALYGIRTYINAYNVGKVGVYQFFDELKEHLASYFKNSGIDYELNSDIDNQEYINSFVYRDLKLVFYEINQNILKHSKATAVKADFIIKNGQLYASFMDNGILKNVNDIERKGNGVTNIRKRVSRIKGEVNFSINPIGTGLKIEIKLNLAQSLIS